MQRPKRPFYFLAVAILPLLFFLQNPKITEPVHSLSLTILRPVYGAIHLVSSGLQETGHFMRRFIKSFENQGHYEVRIRELESQVGRLRELEKENNRLRKLLNFGQDSPKKSVGAKVIGWDPSPWRKTLLLNKGSLGKIKKDMPVMVPEGLVGRVIEVTPNTARVLLLIDPDARVSAIEAESRAQGVVGGQGTEKLMMTYLDLDSGVSIEKTVLSSGVGGVFPKGIPIGEVASIQKDEDGLHLKAEIEPFVDFSKLEEVLCLKSSP